MVKVSTTLHGTQIRATGRDLPYGITVFITNLPPDTNEHTGP